MLGKLLWKCNKTTLIGSLTKVKLNYFVTHIRNSIMHIFVYFRVLEYYKLINMHIFNIFNVYTDKIDKSYKVHTIIVNQR